MTRSASSSGSSSSLTQDAYERIRADLLACRLRPGARLKISELCDTLSVSMSAVREALARLTSDGFVCAEPQRGFRVAPISAEDLRDLTEVRCEIEGMCLERSIIAGDISCEGALMGAFHRLSRTPERAPEDPKRLNDVWSLAHGVFHEALVAACDSPCLLRVRANLYAQSERYRRLSIPLAEVDRDLNQEHKEIMDAVLNRDAVRARSLMKRHLEVTTCVLLKQSLLLEPPAEPKPRNARSFAKAIATDATAS